jgi:hypothetical protein
MYLHHPRSTVPFVPSPRFVLGPFDIYDREETLGALLDPWDPNDPMQLETLLDLHFFPWIAEDHGYTVAHRSALVASVQGALADPNFDYPSLLKPPPDQPEFSLPPSWSLLDPKRFLAAAYEILLKRWGEEFEQNGISYAPSGGRSR